MVKVTLGKRPNWVQVEADILLWVWFVADLEEP